MALRKLIDTGIVSPKLNAVKSLISHVYTSPISSLADVVGQKLLQLVRLKLPTGALDMEGSSLDSISLEGGEVAFKDVTANPSMRDSLNKTIDRLTEIFEDTLIDSLNHNRRIFITFDRIDEAWDLSSFESSQRIIAGLIGASEYIIHKFHGNLRPIIFLREDIFETLDINDKNKLRSDCGQLLAWSKDGLSRMILERVNFFARKSGNTELTKIEDLFDREQMRQQRAPFDHIILRTMLRPRDFIQLFQLVKQDMKDRIENIFEDDKVNEDKLECKSIYNVEPAYSEWLIEEIKDEWKVQYPQISNLLSSIQNNGKTTFTSEDLSASLEKIGVDVKDNDIIVYLKFLFDNSIIGFKVGNSQQWRFKCFFKSQGFVESDLYKVHDGLHRGLNLTESRNQT